MRIGIDLDNTIICYDRLFTELAAEKSLVPRGSSMTKSQVRDRLRQAGREEVWTLMQGEAYGPRIREACPFPGVLDFISLCHRESIPVCIISHKTRHPYAGEKHDLHAAALSWLSHHSFLDVSTGLSRADVFLEETKLQKLARIASEGCTHFIDDLPEILFDPAFPVIDRRIHFDPAKSAEIAGDLHQQGGVLRIHSWAQLSGLLFQEVTS